MGSHQRTLWLTGTALGLSLALGGAALAQEADGVTTASEVVVTASRADRGGLLAPTPTTVLSSEALDKQQVTNLSQVMALVPAFKPTITPSANGVRTQLPGATLADLRGLGANRTLVLVDGMRVPPQASANTTGVTVSPDMNQIPSLLVDRLEVVTGGASAQWGSDAVAGVVNILLRTKFSGLELRAQGGQSFRGDAANYRLGAIAGRDFGALHVTGALDFTKSDGLGDIYTRDWGRREFQIVTNPSPATNGQPVNILSPNVHAAFTPGGLIVGPANFSLRNFEFLPGGQLAPFNAGTFFGTTFMIGGEGQSLAKGVSLAPSVRRIDPYLRFETKLGADTNVFLEGSFSQVRGRTTVLPPRDTAFTIRNDNAYLPATVTTALAAQGLTSFTLSRINYDIGGNAVATIRNETPHVAFGADGALGGGWTWDAHLGWGRNLYRNTVEHNRIRQRFNFAADAVRDAAGNIVCRATLPGAGFNPAAAGCAPLNLFGAGAPSAQAGAYVTGTSSAKASYEQTTAAFNLRGEPFALPAGPVSFAAGLEYRKESERVVSDPISEAGGFEASNATGFTGSFDVKEGYAEVVAPLVKETALAWGLSVNGAVRFADYSTAGSQTTWKVGGTYEPAEGLKIRFTRSRDIRAPALFELYSKGAVSNVPVSVRGFTATFGTNVTVGNPNLSPEKADTITAGVVLEPAGIRGFSATVDFFDINIKDAITSLSAANVGGLCTSGQQFFCNAFTFNPVTGAPTSLTLGVLNAAAIRARGIDFAVTYRIPIERIAPGSLTFNFSGTRTASVNVDLGTGVIVDRSGENSQLNAFAIPRFRGNWSATYALGRGSLTAQVIYISKGRIDNTFNTSSATTINDNLVPDIAYLNLLGSIDLMKDGRLRLFGSINNVFDQKPPPVPSTTLFTPTNGSYYDTVGRAFQVGLTYKY